MREPINHQDLVSRIRNTMLDSTKSSVRNITGKGMAEADQTSASEHMHEVAYALVNDVVRAVAGHEFRAVHVLLENVTLKNKQIVLKGESVIKASGILGQYLQQEVTLLLASAEEFDSRLLSANIEPDQQQLPLDASPVDDEFAAEMGEIAEGENLLFTAVEDEECHLPDGTVIKPWAVVHGTVEVFTPIDAESFVLAAVDHLNRTASDLERDMTPAEVRISVLNVLAARQEGFGIAFHPPYADGETVQDNQTGAPAADAGVKRGPKTAAEKVAAYFAGFDGADSDLTEADCPHERGKLRDLWVDGLTDGKGGKGARFQRPAGSRSAHDMGRAAYAAGAAYLDGQPASMAFPDVGAWRKGWKAAEAEAQGVPVSAPANDVGGLESTGNVAA